MYRTEQVMQEIMSRRDLRKLYEAAKTDAERMEIMCDTAFDMGWNEANYQQQMNNYWSN